MSNTGEPLGRPELTGRTAALWVIVSAAGVLWSARRVRNTYFHFDEWSMLGRVTSFGPIEGATTSFNGHLYLFQDLVYRTQATAFGLENNHFVRFVFLVSLVALHLSLAWLILRLGASSTLAVLIAALLTYMGAASETFLFPFQLSPTFAAAAAIAGTAAVIDAEPTVRRSFLVGALMLLSVLFDSGMSTLALALCGGVVVQQWPRRFWWTVAPSAATAVGWFLVADLGPSFPGSVGDRGVFVARLVVRSAGALVGGGAWAGAVALAGFSAALAAAVRSRALSRSARAVTIAGFVATVLTAVSIAQSRAAIPGFTFFNFNRYIQNVGLPLLITFLPSLIAVGRQTLDRWPERRTVLHVAATLAVALAFASSLDEEREYGTVFVGWNQRVEAIVDATASLAVNGCPAGTRLDPASRPAASLSPQITAALVVEFVERDLIVADPDVDPSADVVAIVCTAP